MIRSESCRRSSIIFLSLSNHLDKLSSSEPAGPALLLYSDCDCTPGTAPRPTTSQQSQSAARASTMEGAITLVRKAAIGGVCGYVFGSPAAMDVPPPPPASTDTPAEMTTPVAMPALDPASLATSFVVGCFVSTIADVVTWPLEALSEGASGASGGGGLLAAVKQRGGAGGSDAAGLLVAGLVGSQSARHSRPGRRLRRRVRHVTRGRGRIGSRPTSSRDSPSRQGRRQVPRKEQMIVANHLAREVRSAKQRRSV